MSKHKWNPNDNYFENEFGQMDGGEFCRSGLNSTHSPWREHFAEFVDDGDSFLDVACGSGADWEVLQRLKKDVKYKGIDYAPSIIAGAEGLCPNAEFKLGDINNIPEEDESWDIVNARHVLCHCEYYEHPIKELLRVAKKRIIITLHVPFPEDDTDHIRYNHPYSWRNMYSKTKFKKFIDELPVKAVAWEELHRGVNETFIVLEKYV